MRATGNIVRQVEAVYLDGMLGTWSDDRLLDRFACEAGERAERAFTAIVERHGPRVYRVCRGVVGDGPTAEDAFQATFLVLARKAGTLRVRDSLGPWLHGVAARLAASARASQLRRNRHEAAVAHRGEPSTTDPERDSDLHRILHAEIGRLPSAYREAVYLCDVEGLSQETVALRLSCAIGTVRSRLSRGRKRLRSRLIRRGIVPVAFAALTSRASAALPFRLAESAARNAVAITSSGASCGMVPAAAVALFEEGMTTMLKFKIRAMIGAAIVGLSATAAVVFAQDVRPGAKAKPEAPTQYTPATADPATTSKDGLPVVPNPNRRSAADANPATSDLLDPFKAVDQAVTSLDVRPDLPGKKDVSEAILKQYFPDLRFRIDKVDELVDPVKVYPLAGPCQLVHLHFKVIICYTLAGGPVRGREEVLYIDRDYLRRAPVDALTDANAPSTSAGTTSSSPRRSSASPDRQGETERRLDDVERKLDRILKALEKAPAESKPSGGTKDAQPTKVPF